MGDKTDIINYQRQFNAQSKVLLNTGRMTERERNAIFWRGFHPDDQQALCKCLIAMHPSKPTGEAFDLKDVFNIVWAIFSGNDDFLLQEPPARSDPIRARSSTRDLPAPRTETRTVRFQDDYREEDDKALEAFIYQLHALPVRDPKYALVYARCATRFPNAMLGIPRPGYQVDTSASYTYQASAPPPPPPQPWSAPAAAPVPAPTTPLSSTHATSTFLRFGPRAETCAFCRAEGHRLRSCTTANEYIQSGRASWINERIHLPNGQPVPFDGTRRGLKASIDAWLTSQTAAAPTPAQATAVLTRDPPPHFGLPNASTSRIEEVVESHILQVREAACPNEEEFSHDIFEVFATEKKRGDKTKAPELSAPPPATSAPVSAANLSRSNAQYRYHCDAEDQQLVSELEEYLLQGKLSLTTPAHILTASLPVRKSIANKLKVRRVETNEYEVIHASDLQPHSRRVTVHDDPSDDPPPACVQPPAFCLPLQELDVLVNGSIRVPAILDTGLQIVVIRHDIVQALGVPINYQRLIEMEGANGATNWTVGCAENLPLQVGDVVVKVHAHVVEHATFGLLLGRPFQQATLCRIEDTPSGEVEVSMRDQADLS